VILDDKTVGDLRIYGLPVRHHPLYLAFLADIDGEEKTFLNELVRRAPDGLRAIFSCCHGFASDTDLMAWMELLRSPASAAYVNTRAVRYGEFAKKPHCRRRSKATLRASRLRLRVCRHGKFMRS